MRDLRFPLFGEPREAESPSQASLTAGIVNVNRAPWPGPSLSAQMRPPVSFHHPLAYCQAPARPAVRVGGGELTEQVRQLFCGQALALVGDTHGHVEVLPDGGHLDGGGLRRVPGGVGQQVAQHLDDAPSVRHHKRQVRRQVDVEVVPTPSGQEDVSGPVHHGRDFGGFGSDLQPAGLDVGGIEQVADQLAHGLGLLEDDPVELANLGRVQLRGGVQQGIGRAQDGGQRDL